MRFRDRHSSLFMEFRWWRKYVGGKWSLWASYLPMADVWIRGWDRPGCGAACLAKEDWP